MIDLPVVASMRGSELPLAIVEGDGVLGATSRSRQEQLCEPYRSGVQRAVPLHAVTDSLPREGHPPVAC